jgi:hypothetical protein
MYQHVLCDYISLPAVAHAATVEGEPSHRVTGRLPQTSEQPYITVGVTEALEER